MSSDKFNTNPTDQHTIDCRYMRAAIRYARRHSGITGTNPSVACLLVASDELGNQWIAGRGVTAIGGRPHAEPVALEEAGIHARGATAYVTLEPCAHHGVTAPCATTLIDAGVSRVVCAQRDPDSRVDSKGFAMLRAAGIEVVENIETQLAEWGLRGYLSRKTRTRPWVFLKLAMTADGYLGTKDDNQVRITGPITNAYTHLLRAQANAIMVASGTIINDDPSLTCRLPGLENRSPVRIGLQHKTPLDPDSGFVRLAGSVPTYIACSHNDLQETSDRLKHSGCRIIGCDADGDGLALPELLTDLADMGIASLMVEGGAALAGAMLNGNLIDEIILYQGRYNLSELLGEDAGGSRDSWVASPLKPDQEPAGFRQKQQFKSGDDIVTSFVRR